jgi:serine/threonine-protein kinase
MSIEPRQAERPPNSADAALWIDRLCDQFEAVWKSQQVPRIEDYLGQVALSARPALLRELLVLELDYRGRRGEQPTAEEYRVRFPDLVSVLEAVFEAGRRHAAPDAPADGRSPPDSPAAPSPTPADPNATQTASIHLPLAGQHSGRSSAAREHSARPRRN